MKDIAAEYVTDMVSLFCEVMCEREENDPAPRSFIPVACSCTYMFAISMRDVVALLNAACFALTMAKLGQAYHVVLPFWQLVFVDCPYFNLSTFICTSISLCFI